MRSIALLLGLAAVFPALASADAPGAVSAAACVPRLTADQLTAPERKRFADLSGKDAESFLATRYYIRQAQAVVAKKCSPAELPNEPELFEVHYLVLPDYKPVPSDEETLKTALQMSLSDYIDKNP